MSINKKDLKGFVRFDGSGRVVSGSLILRKSKPKVGKWQEVIGYECCNTDQTPIVVDIIDSFPFTYPDMVLQSIGGAGMYLFNNGTNVTVTDVADLTTYLNTSFSRYGKFKVVGSNIVLTPNVTTAELFASGGATGIQCVVFAD